MKLPPAAANRSKIRWLVALSAPHPQSSPNVIVPKQSSDTRRPLRPNSRYRISCDPLWFNWKLHLGDVQRRLVGEKGRWQAQLLGIVGAKTQIDLAQLAGNRIAIRLDPDQQRMQRLAHVRVAAGIN